MKENKNIFKKTISMILNIFFYVMILILLIFSIVNLTTKSVDQIPSLFNKGFVTVLSDSMNGKHTTYKVDSFKKDALVFVRMIDEKEALKIGDVVVFYGQLDLDNPSVKAFIIHRIVHIENDYIYTQGDKVNELRPYDKDSLNNQNYEINKRSDVKAIATSKIENIGGTINYLRTPSGFGLCILLPILILLIIQFAILVIRIINKNKIELKNKYETEKELMKQEILKELEKNKQGDQ
ncbi:conserved hypothetical protein [Alteracholeplasma palmae J233]|uniref:Signal peptidase I n=1 Tax=Alteracholeplasma palmae (strain ATCC 49389 / J233) TaxID=1318466 RepID=U4KKH7_ALTPJ|nr:S26 family signal peptidase [Alteracholeplasma palmae]CCV64117.1 conserved hypothetical protein [Alteracholeplasma palmae J233]